MKGGFQPELVFFFKKKEESSWFLTRSNDKNTVFVINPWEIEF